MLVSFLFNQAGYEILSRAATFTLDLLTATKLKVMLVGTGYTPDKDHELVDAGGANDPVDEEIVATGYTGGYGGAGRLALGSPSFGAGPDDTNDRVEFDAADCNFGTLGNGANDTIAALLIIREDHLGTTGDDTETRLIAHVDLADTLTNGTGFQVQWSAEGIIHWTH